MAAIKHSDLGLSSSTHQLKAEKQLCISVHREGRATEKQADGGQLNWLQMPEAESGNAPTLNVLQCASATCFCHRFAMLSCLNLTGWRVDGRVWRRQARMLLMLQSDYLSLSFSMAVKKVSKCVWTYGDVTVLHSAHVLSERSVLMAASTTPHVTSSKK